VDDRDAACMEGSVEEKNTGNDEVCSRLRHWMLQPGRSHSHEQARLDDAGTNDERSTANFVKILLMRQDSSWCVRA
jgi:hypothetical protein